MSKELWFIKTLAASIGVDSLTVSESETFINNATTALSPYPKVDWFTNATEILIPAVETDLELVL